MGMRNLFYGLLAFGVALSQQADFSTLIDSFIAYGRHKEALGVYDSLEQNSSLLSLRQRAQVSLGRAEAYIAFMRLQEALLAAQQAESLAVAANDILLEADARNARGFIHLRQGQVLAAETLLLNAQKLYEATQAYSEHLGYVRCLRRLGVVASLRSRPADAEKFYQRALSILDSRWGTAHPEYLAILHNLASLNYARGRYQEAERLGLEVIALRARILGENHVDYATSLFNLGAIYVAQGRYKEAEQLYLKVREIFLRNFGDRHPDYASILNNLANLYFYSGRYSESEQLHAEVLAIRGEILGKRHLAYASTLHNLANIHYVQGRYKEAEALYRQVLEIRAHSGGMEHPDYAAALHNLALIQESKNKYDSAEQLYHEALELRSRLLGPKHPDYAATLANLANIYQAQGRYAKAESLLKQVFRIWQENYPSELHPNQAIASHNLAGVYYKQGRYAEAESLYLRAKTIREATLGKDHPDYLTSLVTLARLYGSLGQYPLADTLWRESIYRIFYRMRKELPGMASDHRRIFLENILSENFNTFQEYVGARAEFSPIILQLGYRAARSFKGLVLSSVEGMRYLVEQRVERDTVLGRLYREWVRLREQYAFYALQERQREADSVLGLATERERAMVARLPELERYFPDLEREPLYPPLKRSEAVIEVVRVPYEKGDSVLYLYYVLVPEGRRHRLSLYVRRVDAAWERRALLAYEILRSPGAEVSGSAYRLLWGEVDSLLPRGVKAVYFSPDGVYYRVNVATLYDGVSFVGDRYEVRYVASSRRLLRGGVGVRGGRAAVVGAPDFYGTSGEVRTPGVRSVRYFAGGIPPLPGAEAEVRRVAMLLGVEVAVGDSATEGYIKSLRGPEVLHVATHGYFMGEGRDAMLSGGLLLAQAGVWDSLYVPFGVEDGRLTAREAANLNLLGTRWVVLSACETGLGEVKGEGLYGLQRGFLEAGAERVIAALWAVDDAATRELMEGFYRRWVRSRGKSVEAVFSRVLREFRKRYPEPYYWGAFVVMR